MNQVQQRCEDGCPNREVVRRFNLVFNTLRRCSVDGRKPKHLHAVIDIFDEMLKELYGGEV